MNKTIVLEMATKAGKIMLENGAETDMVEETIKIIGNNFGYEINSYATLTGIISTIKDENNNFITNTLRISKRTMDLNKIHEIHKLGKNIKKYSLEQIKNKIELIESDKGYNSKINLFAYAFAAGSFTLLFGGLPKDFLGSSFIGIIIFLYFKSLSSFDINKFFINGLGSSIITFFGLFMYKFSLISSMDTVIIGSMMLLVPGMAITNAVRDIINGDLMAGMARGLEAFFIATSLAVGSGFILTIF